MYDFVLMEDWRLVICHGISKFMEANKFFILFLVLNK